MRSSRSKLIFVWKDGMEYGRKFWYGMKNLLCEMKMDWKKIASMEKSSFVPFHTMPCLGLHSCYSQAIQKGSTELPERIILHIERSELKFANRPAIFSHATK